MKDWINEHKFIIFAVVLAAIGGVYYFSNNETSNVSQVTSTSSIASVKPPSNTKTEGNSAEKSEKSEAAQPPDNIMVDIKGQVKKPGVYQASEGERVTDVIGRAGGLTEAADQAQVNFAEHVQDEMVIYIPKKGEAGVQITQQPQAGGAANTAAGSEGSGGQSQEKIDLNKADVTELQTIPGIGPSKAAAIIEYRETTGLFRTVEDVKNISGIGDKTYEKLKDWLVVR